MKDLYFCHRIRDFTCKNSLFILLGLISHVKLSILNSRKLGIPVAVLFLPTPSPLVLPILAWLLLERRSTGRFAAALHEFAGVISGLHGFLKLTDLTVQVLDLRFQLL